MLREGRFNDIIHCGLPDLQALTHLLKIMLVRKDEHGNEVNYMADDVDFEKLWAGTDADGNEVPYFKGFSFAFIAGAVQNVLRLAVNKADGDTDGLKVTTEQLIDAALAKRGHFDLMDLTPPEPSKDLDDLFMNKMAQAVEEYQRDLVDYDEVYSLVNRAVEVRIDNTSVDLTTETGKSIRGNLSN